MYIPFNENPLENDTGDCTIRAISLATNQSWVETYIGVCVQGLLLCKMPSNNDVWGAYLQYKGFIYETIPNFCPFCYTVKEFCRENNKGTYLLGTGTHVIYAKDGDYYDSWDSGNVIPIICWRKK